MLNDYKYIKLNIDTEYLQLCINNTRYRIVFKLKVRYPKHNKLDKSIVMISTNSVAFFEKTPTVEYSLFSNIREIDKSVEPDDEIILEDNNKLMFFWKKQT